VEGQQGKRRRWFNGRLAPTVAVGVSLIVVVVGGAVILSDNDKDTTQADASDATGVTTAPEPPAGEAPPEVDLDLPASVGVQQLYEEGDVKPEPLATFGKRTVGTTAYANTVTGPVYADGSGMRKVTILTKARFLWIHFVAGIDAKTNCPGEIATVHVEDQSGQVLWGPKEVSRGQELEQTISIPSPAQVILMQRSNGLERSCEGGKAVVAWGDLRFSKEGPQVG
jgi:hypothetical protein